MNTVITIDGPAGSGKSTVAKTVARKLGYAFLDTGAYFRALIVKILRSGIDPADENKVVALFESSTIEQNGEQVLLDGLDVSAEIRKPGVAEKVAPLAASAKVRKRMTSIWREFASGKNIVTEGRDQGSAVFPDAAFKFYLNASVDERAKRRHKELVERGTPVDFEKLKKEIAARDESDKNRKVAPLVKPADAIEIDTTKMTADEVVAEILKRVKSGGCKRE